MVRRTSRIWRTRTRKRRSRSALQAAQGYTSDDDSGARGRAGVCRGGTGMWGRRGGKGEDAVVQASSFVESART